MALFSTMAAIGAAIGVGSATVGAVGYTSAIIAGSLLTGAAAYGAGSLISNASQKAGGPALQYQPPQTQSAETIIAQSQAAGDQERKDLIRAKSRKTVLTGPTGVFGEADTAKKTLLGG